MQRNIEHMHIMCKYSTKRLEIQMADLPFNICSAYFKGASFLDFNQKAGILLNHEHAQL